jgi:hypothetical protein
LSYRFPDSMIDGSIEASARARFGQGERVRALGDKQCLRATAYDDTAAQASLPASDDAERAFEQPAIKPRARGDIEHRCKP